MHDEYGAGGSIPCVWMRAGILSYRLCDRDLDCERCPLDAALRGDPVAVRTRLMLSTGIPDREPFPSDRLYGLRHTWVGAGPDGTVRVGLDAFAAGLLGCCRGVRCDGRGPVAAGEPLCELDVGIGTVDVGCPVDGDRIGSNPDLAADGSAVVTDPYGEGWLAVVETDQPPGDCLFRSDEAGRRASLDLRRLRRRIAVELWSDASAVGPTAADGGEPVSDLRTLLGAPRFLELVRDVLG